MTSLGDDARQTLTIASLEKAKERSLEQHLRLRAPQTWFVLCASVDQYLRTTAYSSATQPTPGALVSTCACGKSGHEKAKCRVQHLRRNWTSQEDVQATGEIRCPSQIHRAAVARVAVKAVKAVTTPTSAIAVDTSAIDDLIVLTK